MKGGRQSGGWSDADVVYNHTLGKKHPNGEETDVKACRRVTGVMWNHLHTCSRQGLDA